MIILQALASLALRFALAIPFWRSGLVRWDGFLELKPATTYLYENEYALNLLAQLKLVEPAPLALLGVVGGGRQRNRGCEQSDDDDR